MKFTQEFIAEARKLGEKATPRPWERGRDYTWLPCIDPDVVGIIDLSNSWIVSYENADYIIEACNNYLAALDEIERLREALHNCLRWRNVPDMVATAVDEALNGGGDE